jgi:hypothetical protein
MLVDIQIIDKPEIHTKAIFNLSDFDTDRKIKEALAIIFMVAGDYALDPELEVDDLKGFISMAMEKSKAKLALFISEDGLELDFED